MHSRSWLPAYATLAGSSTSTGATLLAVNLWRALAVALLIAFTVAASAIFHRWWSIPDPLLRHLHLSNLIVNCGIIGGLLLVASL